MEKRSLLLLSSFAFVLISCANPTSISSSSPLSSSAMSTSSAAVSSTSPVSSSASSSSTIDVAGETKKIDDFLTLLSSKEGQVNQIQSTSIRTSNYLSDAEPLTMVEKDVATTIRYQDSSKGQLSDQNGNYAVQNSEGSFGTPSSYETQIYHDDRLYYRLTKYLDGSEPNSKKTIEYTAGSEDRVLGLGLANEEVDLLPTLKSALTTADMVPSYSFPTALNDNGQASYSYGIKVYESGTQVLRQEVAYAKTITLTSGFISHLEETLTNDMYAGGKKANWFSTTISKDYQQGEYATFAGTLFNPKDFTAA